MRTILYANRRFLISVKRAEEDGEIHTQYGVSVPVKRGELVCSDQVGNKFILTEKHLSENYIPVKKVHIKIN